MSTRQLQTERGSRYLIAGFAPKGTTLDLNDPVTRREAENYILRYDPHAYGLDPLPDIRATGPTWTSTDHPGIQLKFRTFTVYTRKTHRLIKIGEYPAFVAAKAAYEEYHRRNPVGAMLLSEVAPLRCCFTLTALVTNSADPDGYVKLIERNLGCKCQEKVIWIDPGPPKISKRGITISPDIWAKRPYRVDHRGKTIGRYKTYHDALEAKKTAKILS